MHTRFKRARRELKFLRVRLGRVIRDIRRKIAGNELLEERFADLLALAVRVRLQDHRQRGPKVYALHAKALHGNPFDGHTLGPVITELEALTGVETRRIHIDKGYRGHNHAHKFRVWISGQVRRVTAPIRREMRRRAAVEPVIGHLKAEHRMGRNYLKGRGGDRINAVLAAAGYNFGLLLRWLERLLRALMRMLLAVLAPAQNA